MSIDGRTVGFKSFKNIQDDRLKVDVSFHSQVVNIQHLLRPMMVLFLKSDCTEIIE